MNFEEIEKSACLYWPKELAKEAAAQSSISSLLETQEEFLSLLTIASNTPFAWRDVIKHSRKLTPNLFLKHLMVLSDIGGERLQRFSKDFKTLFPRGEFNFIWNQKNYHYKFSKSEKVVWSNTKIRVEKSLLLEERKEFTNDMIDVCMLILWGSSIIDSETLPVEISEKCIIGNMLGDPTALKKFIKERYIVVSRQTGGSTANDLGYLCEGYVKRKLLSFLPKSIKLDGHRIEGLSHNARNLMAFDLVATNTITSKCVGIEISFQVTTNSVIERKAGLAKSRINLAHEQGHKIAYIIDGSGNFQRKNAITTIIENSDYTTNFSDDGILNLAKFIIEGTK